MSKVGLKSKIWKTALVLAAAATVTAGVKLVSSDFFNIKILKADTTVEKVTRGVVDSLEQLPQYNADTKKIDTEKMSKSYGTEDRPFVVLEVVPREEFAQFGYQISGCEPIDISKWQGRKIPGTGSYLPTMLISGGQSYGTSSQQKVWFFEEEKELQDNYSPDNWNVEGTAKEYIGFYEYVGEGNGVFERREISGENDIKYEMVKSADGKGNYIWHTVNDFEKDKYSDIAGEYNDSLNKTVAETGDRIYTKRIPKEGEKVQKTDCYYVYESNDYFLKKTLSVGHSILKEIQNQENAGTLTADKKKELLDKYDKQVKEYPIVIKTITPKELNESVKKKDSGEHGASWIDFADFIFIHSDNGVGNSEDYLKAWCACQDSPKAYDSSIKDVKTFLGEGDDISWEAAYDMYMKITSKKNGAGIAMNSKCYNLDEGDDKKTKKTVKSHSSFTTNIYDMNLNKCGTSTGLGGTGAAANNNVAKLAVMLYAMDYDRFKMVFMNPNNPIITRDCNGVYKLQRQEGETKEHSDAEIYWYDATFLLAPSQNEVFKAGDFEQKGLTKQYWQDFKVAYNYTSNDFQEHVNNRFFTYNGDKSMTGDFAVENTSVGFAKFNGTDEYICDDYTSKLPGYVDEGYISDGKTSTAIALKYIIGENDNNEPEKEPELELNILDIEPCADLESYKDANGNENIKNLRSKWVLSESYFWMTMPELIGKVKKINITHQTTAAFNGKIEDLNTKYDMVYIGVDTGAYRTKTFNMCIKGKNGNDIWVDKILPDWNDEDMDGLVYFHTGDVVNSALKEIDEKKFDENTNEWVVTESRDRHLNFLVNRKDLVSVFDSDKDPWTDDNRNKYPYNYQVATRFNGNDISRKKIKDLSCFINAGKPVILAGDIYDKNENIIDAKTNLYGFIKEYMGNDRLWKSANAIKKDEFNKWYNENYNVVEFIEGPQEYDGTTISNTDSKIKSPNYISRQANGTAKLEFSFKVPKADKYAYKIMFDQNRDGNMSEDETVKKGNAHIGINNVSYKLGASFSGLVQWKILVYDKDNENIHYTKTGCSVVKLNDKKAKKEVKVLQIMPDDNTNLNLKESETFKKYYEHLEDFDIKIDTITLDEYLNCFSDENSKKFDFDLSKDIIESDNPQNNNPKNLDNVNKRFKEKYGSNRLEKLTAYHMFIFGFGDMYNKKDISNQNGAVDFLEYMKACGKSMLFTHDITSIHNKGNVFGYTANKLLRDMMGMNPFKMISAENDDTHKARLKAYQEANKENYDDIRIPISKEKAKYNSQQNQDIQEDVNQGALTHGFTYCSLRRIGFNDDNNYKMDNNPNSNNNFPYKYLTEQLPNGEYLKDHLYYYYDYDKSYLDNQKNGFSNNSGETTLAQRLNKGQITEYPYKISENIKVAPTHAQWYLLNLEDKDVTVWYTLGYDGENLASIPTGVSPYDAANNYYIYSKGNIFYSGVGHDTVNGDMEAKLFVNTMIAAYRASYEPPVIEVTNEEVVYIDENQYEIDIPQEYNTLDIQSYNDNDKGNNFQEAEAIDDSDGGYLVKFQPVEMNAVSTILTTSIYITDEEHVKEESEMADVKKVYIHKSDIFLVKEEEKSDGSIEEEYVPLADGDLTESIDTSNNNKVWITGLKNGETYAIRYPRKYLSVSENNDRILPRVKFDIKNDKAKDSNTTTLTMSSIPLFELD